MSSQKAQRKITDYFPPAPTVEDDHSPSPSNRDLYDDNHNLDNDNHEFEEAYAQVYLAFNQLGNHNNQGDAEELIQIFKGDIPNPLYTCRKSPSLDDSPPGIQSQNSSPQTTSSRSTISIYATQDSAVGTTEYHYTIPIPVIIQEIPTPHATAPPPFSPPSQTFSVPQQIQHSSAKSPSNHSQYSRSPHVSSASTSRNGRSSDTYFSHDSTDYIDVQQQDPSQSQPQSRHRHRRHRRPCCNYECNAPAGAQHADGDGSGNDREWTLVDSEVYMAFAEVFNATKRIEADLLELRKIVEGLWKERFGPVRMTTTTKKT